MIPRTRDALGLLLSKTFPSDKDIDAQTVDAFVDALMRVKVEAAAGQTGVAPTVLKPGESLIYRVRATHARRTPVTSVFTGETESVRVTLPQERPQSFETPVGSVTPESFLLPTVAALRERFGERIGRPFDRVEVVTPARYSGVRFAPMTLYLGYERPESTSPMFVVFEAGNATGKPMSLFLAVPANAVVEEPAGYAPSPFASADHWYTGGLRMAANGRDPEVLFMRSSKARGGDAYIRLHVEYEVLDEVPFQLPASALVEAALRMLAVQKGMGWDQGLIERLIGDVGLWAIPWVDRPDNGAKGGGPTDFVPSVAFDGFVEALPEPERRTFQASIVMLLAAVVRADGKFDRLERIETDWIMNFEVPAMLGETFRFSDAAQAEHRTLFEDAPAWDARPFDERLGELAGIVARLPAPLAKQYRSFVARVCRAAAESSGGWLWFGTKVSKEEKAVLDRIGAALGLEQGSG
jgi:hypothetical protein